MHHLQGFKRWFESWKEEARDKNSIIQLPGITVSHLQPRKTSHSIARLKITFIECSLSLALYMPTD